MATTERDYYELLAVSRTASADEIKRAFRRLAREVHPDVSQEPDADHRFREIVEAYEVLSNSERRELYDRFGHAGLRSGGFQPSTFDLGNLSDLFSAFFGDDIFGGGGRSGGGGGGAPTPPPGGSGPAGGGAGAKTGGARGGAAARPPRGGEGA